MCFCRIVIVSLAITAGLYIVVDGLSGYGQAREQTKQVQIVADASVDIAQINADAAVEIAGINADATKRLLWPSLPSMRCGLFCGALAWSGRSLSAVLSGERLATMFDELVKEIKNAVGELRHGTRTRTITVAKPYCSPARHIDRRPRTLWREDIRLQ